MIARLVTADAGITVKKMTCLHVLFVLFVLFAVADSVDRICVVRSENVVNSESIESRWSKLMRIKKIMSVPLADLSTTKYVYVRLPFLVSYDCKYYSTFLAIASIQCICPLPNIPRSLTRSSNFEHQH